MMTHLQAELRRGVMLEYLQLLFAECYLARMARTFIAFDHVSGKWEAIIEVRPELGAADPGDIERLERRIFGRHMHAGILITPETAYFVRDTHATMEFSTDSYQVQPLATAKLFSRLDIGSVAADDGLYAQVKLWIDAVACSWWTFVPDEALPMMLSGMVGRLAGAHVDVLDDAEDGANYHPGPDLPGPDLPNLLGRG